MKDYASRENPLFIPDRGLYVYKLGGLWFLNNPESRWPGKDFWLMTTDPEFIQVLESAAEKDQIQKGN